MESSDYDSDSFCTDALQPVGGYQESGDSAGNHHSVFNVALCPVAFSLSNGLRAAGDIKFTMYASIFATVVCRVIFSIVLGVWMDLGVIGICLAMVGDWLVKAALILGRYRSRKWTKFQVIEGQMSVHPSCDSPVA